MILYDWDVWHVYSSFFDTEKVDLEAAASVLVKSGIAVCALHRDGRTWWQTDTGVRSGLTTIKLGPDRSVADIKIEVDGGGESGLDGYVAEAWYQASYFRFNELRVFADDFRVPPPYVRAVLGEFHLTSSETGLNAVIYPVIKLFESSVVIVEFRTIAPNREIPLNEFIDRFVNLAFVPFDEVEVPPPISDLATKAFYHSVISWPLRLRTKLSRVERSHEKAVKEKSREVPSGDFVARLAPLTRAEKQIDTLASLAETLFSVIGFVLSNPRRGFAFVLLGQRRLTLRGNWWNGRPHVHLIDFEGQCSSAKENIQMFGAEFGWILGRVAGGKSKTGLRYLSKDLRHFDDYSVFITESASLWVWSKKGIDRQSAYADPNHGHLIYEHQAIIELLEYGYILHRALLAKTNMTQNANEVLSARWAINQLNSDMNDVSHFGELRDLLHHGWKAMRIENLQARISESLSIRQAESSLRETRDNERMRRWLTVLFGVIATPTLASKVLDPIWKLLNWWRPADQGGGDLFFLSITICSIFFIIISLSWISKKLER
jgi:hypothetical protein